MKLGCLLFPDHGAGGFDDQDDLRARESAPTVNNFPPPMKTTPYLSPMDKSGATLVSGDVLKGTYNFRLIKPLGRGGYGKVWLARLLEAEHIKSLPTEVALKVFMPVPYFTMDEVMNRELSALQAISNHDRVPTLIDWGRGSNFAFVSLQYCPAGNLHDLRNRRGMVDEATAWRLLRDVLDALNHAHRSNILHLDVKPANVLLDGFGGFMLTDFGIAMGNYVPSEVMLPGLGTPGYQAPEQQARKDKLIGTQTDLYGLGATVWSAYCGQELSSKKLVEISVSEGSATLLPPLKSLRPETSQTLNDVVMSLLATDMKDRPGGAAEVLARISDYHEGEPTSVLLRERAIDHQDSRVPKVVAELIDPLWYSLIRSEMDDLRFVRFVPGDYLCREEEESYDTFLLLKGTVVFELAGQEIGRASREGTFIGEVASLTGSPRTASARAEDEVWACGFNAAEFERFVMANPPVSIRLIKSLADRLVGEKLRRDTREAVRVDQLRKKK